MAGIKGSKSREPDDARARGRVTLEEGLRQVVGARVLLGERVRVRA